MRIIDLIIRVPGENHRSVASYWSINNISAISWRSVLVVEETGVP